MFSAGDVAKTVKRWKEDKRDLTVVLSGPGLLLNFSGIADEFSESEKEIVISSGSNSVRLAMGREEEADFTTYQQAVGVVRRQMDHENIEEVLALRPAAKVSCSISVRARLMQRDHDLSTVN